MKPLVHLESGGDVTLEMQGGKAFDPQTGEAVVAPTKQSTPVRKCSKLLLLLRSPRPRALLLL